MNTAGGSGAGLAPLLAAGLVLIAATLAFAPCLDNGFLTWDDDVYVTGNPAVRNLSRDSARIFFTSSVSGNYHPLAMLSLAMDWRLFGPDPRAFHAVNLLLHLAACLLVLRLFGVLGLPPVAAAAGALLFAVHPTRTESVAWIADRKDLLGACFFLVALLCHLAWTKNRRLLFYALALAAFLCSLLSKGTAVSLPLVLVLIDRLEGRPVNRRFLAEKAPFFLLAVAFGLAAFQARTSYQGVLREEGGLLQGLALGGYRLVFHHLLRLVAPVNISLLNPFYTDRLRDLPSPPWLLAAAAVIALLAAATAWAHRHERKVAFGLLFFLVVLAPGLPVTVVGHRADRFSYLAAAGIFFAAGEGFVLLQSRAGGFFRRALPAALLMTALLVAIPLDRRECAVWRDSVSLWSDAVRHYPAVAAFRVNLGNALAWKGLRTAALREYDRALDLDPRNLDAFIDRGIVRSEAGDPAGALADLDRALALKPGHAGIWNNRGIVRLREGDLGGALADFSRAVELDPRGADALYNRGNVFARLGRFEQSRADFAAALALDPGLAGARRNLGFLNQNVNKLGSALKN